MSDTNPVDLTLIDEAINRAHDTLKSHDEHETEYQKTLDSTIKLYDLRKKMTPEPEKEEVVVDKDRVKLKDWIPVIGSIGAVLVIVAFEAGGHVLTSKALGFVTKIK